MLHRGVPQETVIGPLLINLYINDMSTRVENETELIQYVYDTVILIFVPPLTKARSRSSKMQTNLFDILMNITQQLIPLNLNS